MIAATTEAFNKHDATALAHLFAGDGDLVTVLGTWFKGADEIEKRLNALFATRLKNATLQTLDVNIRFIKPDVAIVHVSDEISGVVSDTGEKNPTHRELNTWLLIKENGRWFVAAFHNTAVRTAIFSVTSQQPAASAAGHTQVVLLGTGNPFPEPDRSGPATAIVVNGSAYLVDFGPGVVRRAKAAVVEKGVKALEPTNLRVAFVTHLHSDHTVGYPDLIFLRELGGVEQIKEECRDMRRVNYIENLVQDLGYGLRMLARNPGFTAMAVLTLALGIGANTAMFSVANAVLLEPLPYKGAGRLVTLWEASTPWGAGPGSVCDPGYVQWRAQNQVFDDVAAFHGMTSNLTGVGEAERLLGSAVSPNLFHLFGVSPVLGRSFLPEEEHAEHGNVVPLSRQLWERRFGSDPAVVGRAITLDGTSFTVVGVMPAGFQFPNEPSFWEPSVLSNDCSNAMDQIVARLKLGISLERARNDMAVIERQLNQQSLGAYAGQPTFSFVFLKDAMVSNIRPALLILMAAVGFVLLIACANVANMLLARATARQREMAIRGALGASRGRIIRQLLTESILLAVLGGSLAVVFAGLCRDSLVSLIPQDLGPPGFYIRQISAVNMDARVVGFTLLASQGCGLLLGLAATLQASRRGMHLSLKESVSTSTPGARLLSFRNLLVIGEFALTMVLVTSAALLVKSFVHLIDLDPGFQPQHVLTMNLTLPPTKYQTETQMKAFHDAVIERMGALPGVRAVGTVSYGLPLGDGDLLGDFEIEGQREMSRHLMASKPAVGPGYFRALGIPLLQGRSFEDHDNGRSQPVAIVSQSVARRFWPKGDALGKRISLGFQGSPWYSVVGVAADVRQMGPQKEAPLAIYVPYAQAPRAFFLSFMTIVARTDSDPLSMANTLRRAVLSVDPDMPVFDVASMEQLVYKSVASPRLNALLMACFGALALALAVVGIYGVMSYSVAQRTHEIGIRIALGAGHDDVLRMVVGQGMQLAGIGLAIGVAAALALTHLMASVLYGVLPTDPTTFAVMSLVLAAVATLASYIPARRATNVDPMVALRYE